MLKLQQISDLLKGNWQGNVGDDKVEEIWSEIQGNSIMGMFRWLKNGSTRFYEFIVIQKLEKVISLKIKHFNEDITGWEEKDDYIEYILKEMSESELIFGSNDPSEKGRLIYTKPNPSELIVVLEMKDGKILRFNFRKT